ncbi:sodium:dicarboxylate symporter [Emticicia oligotrophica DSM 17448]|uniref:Sodium:dicarboxylate symporter n=1 Tax=Emticicia oligotrophica (strain DSM 17448 / CIP 109782 / MTCC 6937 / GPTSA100-15) TaxID=929562 RepID=A0ABM5N4Q8_EMTOG|nr:dicarboxylate/amino acid:cation symporter [Emticicia oligotrophica]AFK04401.1 sodium:dicarboxylate symporter [Emticicia oligotrophica DSM 17448]
MKLNITWKIFIGMAVGIVVGYFIHNHFDLGQFGVKDASSLTLEQIKANEGVKDWSSYLQLLSKIFLRMIQMILGPLVFSILTVGIAKLGDFKVVGRIGLKTLGYFYFATILSLVSGLVAVNLMKPGKVMTLDIPSSGADTGIEAKKMTLENFITHVFPKSIFEALATNEVLQIVVFSLFFGIALAGIGDKGKVIIKALDAISEVMFKIVGYVMTFAPYAVFGSVAAVIAAKGLGVLGGYLYLIICFFATLAFFILIILWVICIFAKVDYWKLLKYVKSAIFLSFSTASSEASMPLQIEQLKKFGISERIISFVLPLGYSFNLDGSMMYMTFATGFIAQIYGIELSLGQQITMLLTLLLTSKGIAGVPRASLVVIAGTLSMFGLPQEGISLVLAVDWLLDMGRSATSVAGNAVATAVVAKWEGEMGESQPI